MVFIFLIFWSEIFSEIYFLLKNRLRLVFLFLKMSRLLGKVAVFALRNTKKSGLRRAISISGLRRVYIFLRFYKSELKKSEFDLRIINTPVHEQWHVVLLLGAG